MLRVHPRIQEICSTASQTPTSKSKNAAFELTMKKKRIQAEIEKIQGAILDNQPLLD